MSFDDIIANKTAMYFMKRSLNFVRNHFSLKNNHTEFLKIIFLLKFLSFVNLFLDNF